MTRLRWTEEKQRWLLASTRLVAVLGCTDTGNCPGSKSDVYGACAAAQFLRQLDRTYDERGQRVVP
jgi:hypothetical protein